MEAGVARPRLVLATLNRGKVRELTGLLAGLPFQIVALADLGVAALPEETGETYRDNALIKARAAAEGTGELVLADDSGLEVDALGGAPGVHSARYGGPGLDDAGRRAHLLEALRGVPPGSRTARFRCVIALVDGRGWERVVEATVEGTITGEPRGSGGFGYDPLFYYPPLRGTFGELSEIAKAGVSHRGLAALAARRVLVEG